VDTDELLVKMTSAPLIGFDGLNSIPMACGVYAAWLYGEPRCFYVGKAYKLKQRIKQHFSGERGGDQFCLYVYDEYIHELRSSKNSKLTTYEINKLTGKWIQSGVKFKWVKLDENEIKDAEKFLRRKLKPILNPL